MAPTNEPIRERILDDIKDALDAITAGSDYWYTPDVVIRTDPPVLKLLQGQNDTLIYFISEGNETEEHWSTGGYQQCALECFIFGSQLWDPTTHEEFAREAAGEDPKSTMRSKMVHDVKRALNVDWTRGALAQNTNITDVRPAYIDVSETVQKVCFEMRMEILYTYQKLSP